MEKLDNIKFIKQIKDGCCPASINIVLDYYVENIVLYQPTWFLNIHNHSIINSLSAFKSAKILFENNNIFKDFFSFKVIDTESKEDWIQNVKNHIDNDIPVIISTNTHNNSYHITVIYGYDEEQKLLYEMCPTNGEIKIKYDDKLKNYQNGGTDLLIIIKK